MEQIITKKFLFVILIGLLSNHLIGHAQIFGPELLHTGNFGTTADGVNGDANTQEGRTNKVIFPSYNVSDIGSVYQPPTQVYYNNRLQNIAINPGVTVGKALVTSSSSYTWGNSEGWYSNYYTLPRANINQNSGKQAMMAPNNGNYLIVTSTNGMYMTPTMNFAPGAQWDLVYDRYETNTASPSNYFMLVNADSDKNKVFYTQSVSAAQGTNDGIIPGHIYRMSADVIQINTVGIKPDIAFVIGGTQVFNTGAISTPGEWQTFSFDYIVPCNSTLVNVAFRNNASGGNGNDLALDNLSLKEIKPQINISNDCGTNQGNILLASIPGILNSTTGRFTLNYQWYSYDTQTSTSTPIGSPSTNNSYIPTQDGTYFAEIYFSGSYAATPGTIINTQGCGLSTDTISIEKMPDSNCYQVAVPKPYPDIYQETAIGDLITSNVMLSGTNYPGSKADFNSEDHSYQQLLEGTPGPMISVINFVTYRDVDDRGSLDSGVSGESGYAPLGITGVNHPAGTQAFIYDGNNNPVGVISIASNGDLSFQTIPDYDPTANGAFKFVPVAYTIRQANGGVAWTKVDIDLIEITSGYDTSCSCNQSSVYFNSVNFDTEIGDAEQVLAQHYIVNNNTGVITYAVVPQGESGGGNILYYTFSPTTGITPINDGSVDFEFELNPNVNWGEAGGGTQTISFYEPTSGSISYSFYKKEYWSNPIPANDIFLMNTVVEIAPNQATWTTAAKDTHWDHSGNWLTQTGGGYPIWCTDVIITSPEEPVNPEDPEPEANNLYSPVLLPGDACRDITFRPHATVGQVEQLIYRAAYVEHIPTPGQWMMLSAPLKYIYNADWDTDPSWGGTNAFDPFKRYFSYFDLRYTGSGENPDGIAGSLTGNFSLPFANLKQKLTTGLGFGSYVTAGNNTVYKDTLYFPRFIPFGNAKELEDQGVSLSEVTYQYHWSDNGEWINAGEGPTTGLLDYDPFIIGGTLNNPDSKGVETSRGTVAKTTDTRWTEMFTEENWSYDTYYDEVFAQDNRYRFIFEEDEILNTGSFEVLNSSTGSTRLIGNPFMSHLDFDQFYTDNSAKINNYYRLWDGRQFYSYMANSASTDNGVWHGLKDIYTTTPQVDVVTKYIAPMQAFFFEVKNASDEPNTMELTFTSEASVAPSGEDLKNSRLRDSQENENLLNIHLEMNGSKSMAILASLQRASDNYLPAEDIYKLFSAANALPEIYTIADRTAIEINAISQEGNEKIIPLGIKTSQTGSFDIHIDGAENFKAYPHVFLRDALENKNYDINQTNSFSFTKTDQENLEGRLFIVMSKIPNSIGDFPLTTENNLIVKVDDGQINIYSALEKIETIELYDTSGRLRYKNTSINTSSYQFSPNIINSGVFILKIKTEKGSKIQKIIL